MKKIVPVGLFVVSIICFSVYFAVHPAGDIEVKGGTKAAEIISLLGGIVGLISGIISLAKTYLEFKKTKQSTEEGILK